MLLNCSAVSAHVPGLDPNLEADCMHPCTLFASLKDDKSSGITMGGNKCKVEVPTNPLDRASALFNAYGT